LPLSHKDTQDHHDRNDYINAEDRKERTRLTLECPIWQNHEIEGNQLGCHTHDRENNARYRYHSAKLY
jgi:hypothetical protein